MAKSTKASKAASTSTEAPLQGNRILFISGLLLIAIGLAHTVAFVSFFWSGGADRSIFDLPLTELLTNPDVRVGNKLGKFGAWISDLYITQGVGLMAFSVPLLQVIVGLHLLGVRPVSLWRFVWHTFVITVWGSVTLGFTFYGFSDKIYPLVGGAHGYYMARWLMSSIGIFGTLLLLVILLTIYLSVMRPGFQETVRRFITDISHGRISLPNFSKLAKADAEISDPEPDEPKVCPTVERKLTEDIDGFETNRTVDVDPDATAEPQVESTDGMEIRRPTEAEPDEAEFTIEQGGDTEETPANPEDLPPYDPTLDLSSYRFPTIDLLKEYPNNDDEVSQTELCDNKNRIIKTLEDFKIRIESIKATVGPTVTLYELVPAPGIKISRIQSLENDIALSLAALGIRIIAPMPGMGTIGIEVPNSKAKIVSMHSVIKSSKFQNSKYELPIALGKTISNETFVMDLAKTPHMLVAGATGQGKSVGLNAIITSLLYKMHPSQLKIVLIDPKMVEFSVYERLKNHFLAVVPNNGDEAIITNVDRVKDTLNSLTIEMDDRYALLKKVSARNIKEYNTKFINRQMNPEHGHHFLPYIVVVIDEFADLIMTAGKEVEMPIARIAQKARAVGIHMILATQRPSTNIITGVIKANFPTRVAFKVSSMVDSRTILDSPGAQHLIGRGDMLITQGNETIRVQCAFVDTPEVERINDFISEQRGYPMPFELPEATSAAQGEGGGAVEVGRYDSLFAEVAQMVVSTQMGSTSNVQRRFSLGYNRAGKLMDQLEHAGIVGPAEGSKPRNVLVQTEMDLERILQQLGLSKNGQQ